jgi:hypothetical protein
MATPIKTALFFLCALMALRAPPALSLPLASGIDTKGVTADASKDRTVAVDETTQPMDGSEGGQDSQARIVDHLAYGPGSKDSEAPVPQSEPGMTSHAAFSAGGGSHTPGWMIPAAAVGAGGTLFAVLSHGKNGSNGSSAAAGLDGRTAGTPGAGLGHGPETPGDETPSAVPEPGTLVLMGLGIASVLGRRKIARS